MQVNIYIYIYIYIMRQSRLCNFLRRLLMNKGLGRNVAVGLNISGLV
jgi:hypothetical protein